MQGHWEDKCLRRDVWCETPTYDNRHLRTRDTFEARDLCSTCCHNSLHFCANNANVGEEKVKFTSNGCSNAPNFLTHGEIGQETESINQGL